jgi:circadian clock protein KaiB
MKKQPIYKFLLYIAGDGPNSSQAVANLGALCETYLAGQYETEVVDVLRDEKRALDDSVMMTPLLVKLSPGPVRKIVGGLTGHERVLAALGIPR